MKLKKSLLELSELLAMKEASERTKEESNGRHEQNPINDSGDESRIGIETETETKPETDLSDLPSLVRTESHLSISKKAKIGGFICLALMISTWVSMSFIAVTDERPVFTRTIVNTVYTFVLIPWYLLRWQSRKSINTSSLTLRIVPLTLKCNKQKYSRVSTISVESSNSSNEGRIVTTSEKSLKTINSSNKTETQKRHSRLWRNLLFPSAFLAYSTIACGTTWYFSLEHTDPAVNNTIYQSQVAFVYFMSAIFLKSQITLQKSISVILCIGGVALISFGSHKKSNSSNSVFGLIMCVISTILYAVVEVFSGWASRKYYIKQFVLQDGLLLQGMSGIWTILTGWILLLFCHYCNIEKLTLPDMHTFILILSLAILDTVYFGAVLIGVALTSPFLMAVGSILIVPVSFVVDLMKGSNPFSGLAIIGVFCIITGFALMELSMPMLYRIMQSIIPDFCIKKINKEKKQKPSQKVEDTEESSSI